MTTGYVNGTPTAPNAEGVVVGTGSSPNVAGTGSLSATGGNASYYVTGTANTGIIIQAQSLEASSGLTNGIAASAVLYNFAGAGTWSGTSNDFLAFTGFGAGSTLTFEHYGVEPGGVTNDTLQFYDVHDSSTGNDYTIFIHSLDGNVLTTGDYGFFA